MMGETVWLSLGQMSTCSSGINRLFPAYQEHTRRANWPEGTVAKFATVQTEGSKTVSRDIEYFNSTSSSPLATASSPSWSQFRIWATQRLRNTSLWDSLDDERLKRAAAAILTNCWRASVTSARRKKCFGAGVRYLCQVSITTRPKRQLNTFSRRYKTRCTGQLTANRSRNHRSTRMPPRPTWGSHLDWLQPAQGRRRNR